MYVMFGEFDFLLRVFDPDRFIRGKGGELKRMNQVRGCSTQAAYLG